MNQNDWHELYWRPRLKRGRVKIMVTGTLCPGLLVASHTIPHALISQKLLDVAKTHIDTCKKLKIRLMISNDVFTRIMVLFPWNCEGNDELRQLTAVWRAAVLTPFTKNCDFVQVPFGEQAPPNGGKGCLIAGDEDLANLWEKWLTHWSNGIAVQDKFIKGVASDPICCTSAHEGYCNRFILVLTADDWQLVRFPWYIKYPLDLPAEGETSFSPPSNWETQPLARGPNNGYLDLNDNEWVWDKLHDDHWDVQLVGGDGYKRVTTDGRVI